MLTAQETSQANALGLDPSFLAWQVAAKRREKIGLDFSISL